MTIRQAAAAYNAGPRCVEDWRANAHATTQKKTHDADNRARKKESVPAEIAASQLEVARGQR